MDSSFTNSWVRKSNTQFVCLAILCAAFLQPAWGSDDSYVDSSADSPSASSSVKQFIRSFFQNINASPKDAYVFPAEFGKVDPMALPNFHQVEPYLFRGGAPSPAGLKILQQMGIKTIIDLRKSQDKTSAEGREARKLGMEYVNLPVSRGVPQMQYQEKFYNVVDDASKKINKGPVFVHCDFGCDRTGYMVSMWRIQHDHWSSHDAMEEMFRYGYLIHLAGPEEPKLRKWMTRMDTDTQSPAAK